MGKEKRLSLFIHGQERTLKITNCPFKLGCIQKVTDFLFYFTFSVSRVKTFSRSTLCFCFSGKDTSIFEAFLDCCPSDWTWRALIFYDFTRYLQCPLSVITVEKIGRFTRKNAWYFEMVTHDYLSRYVKCCIFLPSYETTASIACGYWNSQELPANQSVLVSSTTSRAIKQAHLSGSHLERELIPISSPALFLGQAERGERPGNLIQMIVRKMGLLYWVMIVHK